MNPNEETKRSPEPVRRRRTGVNVPMAERIASIGIGGLALFSGRRRSLLPKIILSTAGLALIGRGVSGRCPYYRVRASRDEVDLRRSILISAPRSEVFAAWRNLEQLPLFLTGIDSVVKESESVSHWTASLGPVRASWTAEIVEEDPDRRLLWRSLPGSDVDHDGLIELTEYPNGNSTLITVEMLFRPTGIAGFPIFRHLARRLTDELLAADLIRLRQFIETGEISTGASRREDASQASLQEMPAAASHNADPIAEV